MRTTILSGFTTLAKAEEFVKSVVDPCEVVPVYDHSTMFAVKAPPIAYIVVKPAVVEALMS